MFDSSKSELIILVLTTCNSYFYSWISTLWQQEADHACFLGRGCLLSDLSRPVPIQDLCVIGKVCLYT